MKMQPTNLRKNSKDALSNSKLQLAMGNMRRDFVDSRGRAIGQMPEYDLLKADAKSRKDHTLANLDHYLEAFSEKCEETGGKVHWAVECSRCRGLTNRAGVGCALRLNIIHCLN